MIAAFLRVAFWSAIAVAFVLAVLPQPPALPMEPTDKIQHMVAFFTLAVLGSLAYPLISALRLAAWLIAFGGLIELVQMIPALHRDAEALDWGADALAAFAGLAAVRLLRIVLRPTS